MRNPILAAIVVAVLSACGQNDVGSMTRMQDSTDPVAPENCVDGDEFTCRLEHEIIRLTNNVRVNSGVSVVLADKPRLSFVARDWSQKQANSGSISHSGFPGARTTVYQNKFGSMDGLDFMGENVAMSGYEFETPEQVAKHFIDLWWGSSGHRANMLRASFTAIGASAVRGGNGYYATQVFADGN